jgi:hypothetical protein
MKKKQNILSEPISDQYIDSKSYSHQLTLFD